MQKILVSLTAFLFLLPLAVYAENNPFTRPLHVGSTGADVSTLQQLLKNKGYFVYPTITGYFGSVTWKAVAAYQKDNDLEQVGSVGPKTRALLNAAVAASTGGSVVAVPPTQTPASTAPQVTCTAPAGLTCYPGTNMTMPYAPGNGYIPGFGGSAAPDSQSQDNTPEADTTAPTLSSISSGTPAASTSTISWTTNEAATSRVVYGTTTSYGSATTSSSLVTSHSLNLSDLNFLTTYHYAVVSTDAEGNTATSSDQTLTTAVTPLSSRIVFLGDSITAANGFAGFPDWATLYSEGRYYLRTVSSNGTGPTGWKQGVTGNTTSQMLTRWSNVSAESPKVVVILGGTNDIAAGGASAATIQANLRQLYDNAASIGAKVVAVTILPRSSPGWSGAMETTRTTVNAWIQAQTDLAAVIDSDTYITSTSTQLNSDGTHPNAYGAFALGQPVGAAIEALISSDTVLYDPLVSAPAENLILNPFFTGGTTIATSWSFSSASNGLTKTLSKTTYDGSAAQQIDFSGVTTSNVADILYQFVTPSGGLTGDQYEFWVEFKATNLAGINGFSLAANRGATAGINIFSVTAQASSTNLTYPITGVLRSPAYTLTSDGQQIQPAFSIIPGLGGTVDAQVIITRAGLRKVPTGQ